MIIFATILFALSMLTAVSMFLAKFGQFQSRPQVRVRIMQIEHQHVSLGLYFRQKFSWLLSKLWHFILEAKDLTPSTTKSLHNKYEKVKNVLRVRIRSQENDPEWLPEIADLSSSQVTQNPEDLYLETIKKNPHDRAAYEALGRLYLQDKNYADAMQTYEYLTKLDPTRDVYYSNLGLSYYSLNEFGKARDSYEKALSINNKIPTRWINLALCFEALADFSKAVKAINSALQLDKMNLNYMSLLADAYIKLDNKVRAEEVLEQILMLEPTNKVAREKLMRLKI